MRACHVCISHVGLQFSVESVEVCTTIGLISNKYLKKSLQIIYIYIISIGISNYNMNCKTSITSSLLV